MATTARRGGVLALESTAASTEDRFLRESLLMVIDGTDQELTRQILELEIDAFAAKQEQLAKIFEKAGGYSPTMGIIGTVMGLIKVLSDLQDPNKLGPSIAVAFTATLYGVVTANLIYLPLASKIKSKTQDQVQLMEMQMEGIMALQAGENPQLVRKKLVSFLQIDSSRQAIEKAAEKVTEDATGA